MPGFFFPELTALKLWYCLFLLIGVFKIFFGLIPVESKMHFKNACYVHFEMQLNGFKKCILKFNLKCISNSTGNKFT